MVAGKKSDGEACDVDGLLSKLLRFPTDCFGSPHQLWMTIFAA